MNVKDAASVPAAETVTVWVTEFWPDAFMTVNVTA